MRASVARWGLLRRFESVNIKTDTNGNDVYFHWGVFGEGRAIPSPEEKDWLHAKLRLRTKLAILGLAAVVLVALVSFGESEFRYLFVLGALFFVAGIPSIVVSSAISSRTLLWPLSRERRTLDEQMLAITKAMGRYGIAICFVLAALVALAGGLLILSSRHPLAGMFLIALALWVLFRLWRLRRLGQRYL